VGSSTLLHFGLFVSLPDRRDDHPGVLYSPARNQDPEQD